MSLELSLSEKVENEGEVNSKEFSERFQKEFHAKEKEMKSITSMLENLSGVLGNINRDTRSSLLASEPGAVYRPSDPKRNYSKYNQRGGVRNQSRNSNIQRNDTAWMNKLHLDGESKGKQD